MSRLQALRKVHPILLLLGGIVLLVCIIALLPIAIMAAPGAAAAIWLAHKRKPSLPLRHFIRSRGLVLTALGGTASALLVQSLDAAYAGSIIAAFAWALPALGIAYLILEITGEKIMKSVMQLVPAGQQSTLDAFLRGTPAAAGGQVSLAHLVPAQVIEAIKGRVIGQDQAVEQSVSLIFRRARLLRPAKPVAVLLYVGATGAGKTELAKALAEEMFDGRMVRVDCAELTESHSAQRLIGAPPGYQGSEQGGWLCRELGAKRTGVLLLDEIEKAHPNVLTMLMALLDEARITEQSTGTTYSATGFVVVMTSNAASSDIAKIVRAGGEPTERNGRIKDALVRAGFKPEVIGRVDSVLPFGDLSRANVAEIVGLFLQRFARDAGIEIRTLDAGLLIDLVTKRESMAGYGVREVVRLVESAVVDGLLEARDAGYSAVAIGIDGDRVRVAGVA